MTKILLACARDKSWRVRYMVANCFVDIANGLGAEITKSILHVFVDLLQDGEVEVRSAASGRISGVSKLLDIREVISSVLPCITKLIKDESQQVRKALASDVMLLSAVFGTKGTDEHLLPIFLQLLKDDVPEVRLNVISKLDQVTSVIGLDKVSEFLIPAIMELGKNEKWRIRLSVIRYIPPLAKQLSVEFFIEKLSGLCYGWLTDSVYAIRQAAVETMKELTVVFGEDFARIHVIPKVVELQQIHNYLHRITLLSFVSQISSVLGQGVVEELFLPLALALSSDPIPNIRFSCASTLEALGNHLDRNTVCVKIKPILEKLRCDSDSDVCLYASRAIKNLNL
eukprot:TRINITY_DN5011_c0_g1_i2.p1 TRINITY_DN5011_c0_g1~~TRINITY_DN5011_c0_g1_i2.p1  ORF type:complete len:341 (+),score=70.00 TRINITY_DN5011_c0_g1_i2:940-1962(+)